MNQPITLKDVYVISDYEEGKDKKSRWTKIGIGFVNKDDSINVVMDAIPVSGRIHIRDKQPRKERSKS